MRALLILLLMPAVAIAHEWYPPLCCNERDCRPVEIGGVTVTKDGYRIEATGQIIPFNEAQPSPDGNYHTCTQANGRVRSFQSTGTCFWAPLGV